ncbi:hypothetical protein HII17_00800 [Thalassotalea sp. M1531]|uniref:Uncharacterized protein n=1 Tax=Thalassotalea algicola TaxID=2716224 RepID=A0A7Y0LBM2_9GAMM|nr:hypothetical protein [Thalassotalea algicola]NMP30085.1 hypothetical protein [Thalassotalea algicola]
MSLSVNANNIDIEDPHICKNTLANFPQPIVQPLSSVDALINAVRLHCLDQHKSSVETLSPVLTQPGGLSTAQLTYAYILHSINLNNLADDQSCEAAKLSMAHAANADSVKLAIRAELNYFSFCDVYDENTPHALKRLYELSKVAIDIDSLYLQMTIHNQISYVYYMLDQNQLSAEEGEKALALSKAMQSDDYFIILFNLIDAYLDAGEVELAEQKISLFGKDLSDKSTKWERYLYHYAQSYLAFLRKDYQQVLDIDQAHFQQGSSDSASFVEKLAVFKGISCAELKNMSCVQATIEQYFSQPDWQQINRLTLLELYIKWFSHQQDLPNLSQAQQRYFDVTYQKLIKQQQAAKVLGVAKLNNEIIRLNSEETLKQLAYQNEINRVYLIALLFAGGLLLVFIMAYVLLKRRVKQQVITVKKSNKA